MNLLETILIIWLASTLLGLIVFLFVVNILKDYKKNREIKIWLKRHPIGKLYIPYSLFYEVVKKNELIKKLSRTREGLESLEFKNFIKNNFKEKLEGAVGFNMINDIKITDNPKDLILVITQI